MEERLRTLERDVALNKQDIEKVEKNSKDWWSTMREDVEDIKEKLDKLAETEYYTRKVWIDDRPIFGAIVNFGALPNSTEKRVASGVPSGATVIRIKGYSKDVTDVVATIPLPYSSVQVYHDDATQEVVVLTSIDRSSYTETYIVLEYVKEA